MQFFRVCRADYQGSRSMADGTHVDVSSPSRLAHMRLKMRELVWETQFFARLGQTWPERMSIAKLVAMLYTARLMPFNTHRWETTILVPRCEVCRWSKNLRDLHLPRNI